MLDETEIYLVRHGETVWNRAGRLQGHKDSPLTDRGREQAERVARALLTALGKAPKVRLVSSSLGRALETAWIIVRTLDVSVETDTRLGEAALGSWSGLTRTEVEAGWPACFAAALTTGTSGRPMARASPHYAAG